MQDYAGKVDSYICQHDGKLGYEKTMEFRKQSSLERPLTREDADNWIFRINIHI